MFNQELRQAKTLFPAQAREQTLMVHHPSKGVDHFTDILTWLQEETLAGPALISSLFTAEGKWHYPSFPELDLLNLAPADITQFCDQWLSPLYEAASHSLDGMGDLGFNRHDRQHISYVDRVSQSLLAQATPSWNQDLSAPPNSLPAIDVNTQRRTTIAAWGHDLGNIFSRPRHPFISPSILLDLFPRLKHDPVQWRRIRRAIELHHETVALALLRQCWPSISLEDNSQDQVTIERVLITLRTFFGPEALALIIADKTDVGRHRISRKIQEARVIEDHHLEVNLLGYTQDLVLAPDATQLTWQLIFDMRLGELDQGLWHLGEKRRHNPGRKVVVSKLTKDHFENSQLSLTYFDVWKSLFWNLYLERNTLAIWCLFALFPRLREVKMEFIDSEVNQGSYLVVSKEYLLRDFRKLERVLKPGNGLIHR